MIDDKLTIIGTDRADLDFNQIPGAVIWPVHLSMPAFEVLGDVTLVQEFPGDLRLVGRVLEARWPWVEEAHRE